MRSVRDSLTQKISVSVVCSLVTVPLAFAVLAGPLAAVAGVLPVVAAIALGPGIAIVAAHLVAIAVVPDIGLDAVLVFEGSLAPLIATPRGDQFDWRDAGVAWLAAVGFGVVIAIAVHTVAAQWLIAAMLLATTGLTLYGIHRFELVTLDLIAESDARAVDE